MWENECRTCPYEEWEVVTRITWKIYKLFSKFKGFNYQNNLHISKIVIILSFLWKRKSFCSVHLFCFYLILWEMDLKCFVKCTHTYYIYARGIILKWLNQQQQEDICICRTHCVPAGGYRAYIQINSMFVYSVSKWRWGGEAQQQQKQQKPRRFGERPPCALSVGVRKTQADGHKAAMQWEKCLCWQQRILKVF